MGSSVLAPVDSPRKQLSGWIPPQRGCQLLLLCILVMYIFLSEQPRLTDRAWRQEVFLSKVTGLLIKVPERGGW